MLAAQLLLRVGDLWHLFQKPKSDKLSDGIVKQFPQKFGNGIVSTTGR